MALDLVVAGEVSHVVADVSFAEGRAECSCGCLVIALNGGPDRLASEFQAHREAVGAGPARTRLGYDSNRTPWRHTAAVRSKASQRTRRELLTDPRIPADELPLIELASRPERHL